MSNQSVCQYDIGELKNSPDVLYDLAVKVSAVLDTVSDCPGAEVLQVLQNVRNSLWSNLPPVVMIDLRDPDDPSTWGEYGEPPFLRLVPSDR